MSYFVWNKIDHAVVREDDGLITKDASARAESRRAKPALLFLAAALFAAS